jgi:hypothetical protein
LGREKEKKGYQGLIPDSDYFALAMADITFFCSSAVEKEKKRKREKGH